MEEHVKIQVLRVDYLVTDATVQVDTQANYVKQVNLETLKS